MPGEDHYINPVLQSLCSNALLELMDQDADKELSFDEFKHCLDPRKYIKFYKSYSNWIHFGHCLRYRLICTRFENHLRFQEILFK